MSNPVRKRLHETLGKSARPLSVAELAELFELSAPLTHYHLKVLEREGLVVLAATEPAGPTLNRFYTSAR